MFDHNTKKHYDNLPLSIEEANDRIAELETQMDNLINNMSFGFFLYEIVPDGTGQDNIKVLRINQIMANLLRVDRETSVGKFFYELWPGQGFQIYLDIALNVARTGISQTNERYDDDLGVYLNVTMYRPKIGQVAVIASDRSAMVKAEENLEKAYRDISTILSEIPAPICVMNKENGTILSNNMAFVEMCGHAENESMVGESIKDYLEIDSMQLKQAFKTSTLSEEDFICELKRTDGAKIQVKVFSRLLKYKNEDAYASHFINLTKQRSDEKALREAARIAEEASVFKSSFLANMSHEIRTPMNAIIGMAQVARQSGDPHKIGSCIDQIELSSHHLLGLINDILDMSKIEAGKMQLAPESASLQESIDFVINIMSSRAKERGISIIQSVSVEHFHVMVDTLRLNQVLINLISNAVKFSKENSEILLSVQEISCSQGMSEYQFSIKDHGIGMTEEQIGRLFESFEQADSSTSRKYGGTGLGLSITKSIVEMMGGQVGVTSVVDEGSDFFFTIRLPVSSVEYSPDANTDVLPNKKIDFSKLRILVVDDVEINRDIVAELLKAIGAAIDEAADGKEAVEKFVKSGPGYYDVILMDMQMPVIDGLEATRQIRSLKRSDAKSTAIIAMTANVFAEDIERTIAAGMNAHVGKPIDRDAVISTIARVLSDK